MPLLYPAELASLGTTQPRLSGFNVGGKLRRYVATITLASQVAGTDWFLLARLRSGEKFIEGRITSSVSLGSAVVAIGTNSTHASNGQFRAAAAFTAVDIPTLFGLASAKAGARLAADTDIFMTWASANLPASGTFVAEIDVLSH
ncbi:MAG: hypothetical protein INH13_25690 [Cupriavidus sp.]|nr:hypothetical protein [Cupriavidus sp.]